MKSKVQVVQAADVPEVPTVIIAQHIERIGDAMTEINRGRLTQKAIILLIQDITGLSQRDIKRVLDAQSVLANVYLKPKGK